MSHELRLVDNALSFRGNYSGVPNSSRETGNTDLNMALPCRVSVYSEGGKTKIGMMKPSAMLKALSDSPALARVAQEVEETIIQMIAEAK